jgi:hypothetical protein
MKKTLLGVALAIVAAQAGAADAGLGVSLRSDDAWIYVPIDIGKVRLEPSVRYVDSESTSVSSDASFPFPFSETRTTDARSFELSVGVFGLGNLLENVRVYYGARLAYIDSTQTERIRRQIASSVTETTFDIDSDGYRVSPTLGFEYAFNRRFSIGAEAEWFYQDSDADLKQSNGDPSSGEGTQTGTASRVIVRFYF